MRICDLLERAHPIEVSSIANNYVDDVFYRLYDQLIQSKSLTELINQLNRASHSYNIKFTAKQPTDPNPEYLSARFRQMGIAGGIATINGGITLFVNHIFLTSLNDEEVKDRLIDSIRSIVAHELTHREQGIRSQGKIFQGNPKSYPKLKDKHAEYLSDPQEVMANAQQIIVQLQNQNISTQDIIQALKTNNNAILDHSSKWLEYTDRFKTSDHYKVLPRLQKTIVDLLPKNK